MSKKIVMFGTGGISHLLGSHCRKDVEIVAYLNTVDRDIEKINGIPVIGMKELKNAIYDYIVVAFNDVRKGIDLLKSGGVAEEKIVGYSFNGAYLYSNNDVQKKCNQIIHEELQDKLIPSLFDIPTKEFYLCAMNINSDYTIIERDFVREQTLKNLVYEITRKNVKGNVAELGVYKGEFSKKINKLFPDRTLYMFDTFEGFDQQDTKSDKIEWCDRLNPFDSVEVKNVLESMPFPEKCCIKKGYFPGTYDLEEKFAFVSIDADLYNPIKSGLEIFYPNLSEGGYIMVHDYNNIAYSGAMDAVIEYCDQNNISYVPIPDICGSVVITK